MKKIVPITIGNRSFSSNVFYAPLAGCSDYPFRMMSSIHGKPALHFCEMVKMDALIRYDKGTFGMLEYASSMRPIGAQLCGSKPEIAAQSAKILEELGFDTIDLNCGCPVDKVTKDGSGSGLLKDPQKIGDIVSNIVSAVNIPVTVKMRAGWDDDQLVYREIVRIVEAAGASAITLHARTREQGYSGQAQWGWIRECVEAATKIPVIGNGDVFAPQDALRMLEETGCHGILIARGTMGQPWIAEDIRRLDEGVSIEEKSIQERREYLLQHFEFTKAHQNERKALLDMRRVGCWYFSKAKRTRQFRDAIVHAQTLDEIEQLIKSFPVGED